MKIHPCSLLLVITDVGARAPLGYPAMEDSSSIQQLLPAVFPSSLPATLPSSQLCQSLMDVPLMGQS